MRSSAKPKVNTCQSRNKSQDIKSLLDMVKRRQSQKVDMDKLTAASNTQHLQITMVEQHLSMLF